MRCNNNTNTANEKAISSDCSCLFHKIGENCIKTLLLNPKLDLVFKKMFTVDAEILVDLINSVLRLSGRQIMTADVALFFQPCP
ncbi:MAG: hypothetical protein GY795_24245 [Desulfobacterales bacterium]|nr:hypothetical protein [Desulfobacterales bacterium]